MDETKDKMIAPCCRTCSFVCWDNADEDHPFDLLYCLYPIVGRENVDMDDRESWSYTKEYYVCKKYERGQAFKWPLPKIV